MSSRYFPFRAIGYECNPFRALTVDEEAALTVLPAAVLDEFHGSGTHLQILGDMGRGKSATLLGLLGQAESSGLRVAYAYLPEGADRFQTDLGNLDLFILDEAQRLSRRERHRLLEAPPPSPLPIALERASLAQTSGFRLVLSSHADLTADFARHQQPVRTVRLESLGPEHARAVIERRLHHFALGDRPRATLTPDAHAWLTATFGDDLRATLALLYEAFQTLTAPVPVDAERLRAAAPLSRAAGEGLGEGARPYRRGASTNGW
jgi:hypothetical protein